MDEDRVIEYRPLVILILEFGGTVSFTPIYRIKDSDIDKSECNTVLEYVVAAIRKELTWHEFITFFCYDGENPEYRCFKSDNVKYFYVEDTRFS